MNVLVTGGAGYIGSACVEELLNAGHRVTVFDNLSEGHRSAVDPRAAFVEGHLGDRESIDRTLKESGAKAIVHFAAHALVGESMTQPGKYFRNNVAHGLNLLDAAVGLGVERIVFSSTCATYGPPERLPMTEDLPQRPINPYGESKLMFEKVLQWYQQVHGLAFVAFRYFNAAGATERFGEHHRVETHLIPNVLRVALGDAFESVFSMSYSNGTASKTTASWLDGADIAGSTLSCPGSQSRVSMPFTIPSRCPARCRRIPSKPWPCAGVWISWQ